MVANVQRGLEGSLESRSDRELESLLRETDGFTVRLEKLEESLTSDLRSVEEQVRPLRERALRAQEPRGAT